MMMLYEYIDNVVNDYTIRYEGHYGNTYDDDM